MRCKVDTEASNQESTRKVGDPICKTKNRKKIRKKWRMRRVINPCRSEWPHRSIGTGTIGKYGLVAVDAALLEEVCHWVQALTSQKLKPSVSHPLPCLWIQMQSS